MNHCSLKRKMNNKETSHMKSKKQKIDEYDSLSEEFARCMNINNSNHLSIIPFSYEYINSQIRNAIISARNLRQLNLQNNIVSGNVIEYNTNNKEIYIDINFKLKLAQFGIKH